jgi:signal peptidase I
MLGKLRIALVLALLVLALAATPFRPLKITGRSMEPTFHDGETYLLDLFYWKSGGVHRNDIVVVQHEGETWVKRLVGMPGDTLQLRYDPEREDWITSVINLTEHPNLRRDDETTATREVGPGEIFVVGDNVNFSTDSTKQEAGPFQLKDIVGVVRTFTLSRRFPYRAHL